MSVKMFLVDPSNLNHTWESQFKFFILCCCLLFHPVPFRSKVWKLIPHEFCSITSYNLQFQLSKFNRWVCT
ncbi:unnamed protein product [Musa hybrid cultivar]